MKFRPMTGGDVAAGLRLCRAAGWNQTEADWRFFLSYAACSVAEVDGSVAGTVVALPYGWISMLLVDPQFRRRGIGAALLEEGLRLLEGVDPIRLDASPAGKPIYDKYGFEVEYEILRLRAESPTPPDVPPARRATPEDLPLILALDREVFGYDRAPLLRYLFEQSPESAYLTDGGFALGRPGHIAQHIGPVVAISPQAAASLIAPTLQRKVIMDLTHPEELTSKWLRSANLAPERPFTRMYRGSRPSGDPVRQFAIAGPELG